MTAAIPLKHDGWTLHVQPRSGGLARCVFHGHEILRPTPLTPFMTVPANLCYYPLLPFFNRIRNGCFTFKGRSIELEPALPAYPHALHGHGWQGEWRVLQSDDASCMLCFEGPPADGWPWRYRAAEKFSVCANVLTIELALENLSDDTMPAGVGFHPFFARPASARLCAPACQISKQAAEQFPSTSIEIPAALDFRHARPVRDASGVDRCYSGWGGTATIGWDDSHWRVELKGKHLEYLHLFVPADRDFFCVEPVSHSLDAFNYTESTGHNALALGAGEQLTAALEICCRPTSRMQR